MALLRAPVYGLDEKLHYGAVGYIVWDGKHLYTDPAKNAKLRSILRPYELTTASGMERFDAENDPEAWIKNLYRRYLSAELRVDRANEVLPPTGKRQHCLYARFRRDRR
jgi:hypothetical protein